MKHLRMFSIVWSIARSHFTSFQILSASPLSLLCQFHAGFYPLCPDTNAKPSWHPGLTLPYSAFILPSLFQPEIRFALETLRLYINCPPKTRTGSQKGSPISFHASSFEGHSRDILLPSPGCSAHELSSSKALMKPFWQSSREMQMLKPWISRVPGTVCHGSGAIWRCPGVKDRVLAVHTMQSSKLFWSTHSETSISGPVI